MGWRKNRADPAGTRDKSWMDVRERLEVRPTDVRGDRDRPRSVQSVLAGHRHLVSGNSSLHTGKSQANDQGQAADLMAKASRPSVRLDRVPVLPYHELAPVLRELATSVQDVLDGNLVGVYLVGSLATGDFDLDSDVDFLVVTQDDVAEEASRSLQAMHERIHGLGCYPAEHLEGSYISRAVLSRAEAIGVQPLWYLDNGSTVLERSTHDNQWHVRWVLRERGITLVGPEAASYLAPVPVEAVRGEAHGVIGRIAQEFTDAVTGPLTFWTSRFGQSYAVLQLCRVLLTVQTGTVESKLSGVNWALEALDAAWAELIRQAWTEREGVRHCIKIRQRAAESALMQTHEFIKYAVRESEARLARWGTGDIREFGGHSK